MVAKKGTRKLDYNGNNFYWYVRWNDLGKRIHILSEDKKIHLEIPPIDTEIVITPNDVRKCLDEYYSS